MKYCIILLALAISLRTSSAETMMKQEMACRSLSDSVRVFKMVTSSTPTDTLNEFFNRLISTDRCIFLKKKDHVIVETADKKSKSVCVIPDGKADCYWIIFAKDEFEWVE